MTTSLTESSLAAIIAGLKLLQSRLPTIAPSSKIGTVLTKDGEYALPTDAELEALVDQLTQDQAVAPEVLSEPPQRVVDAIIRIVVMHPTSIFTPNAIKENGYDNLSLYVDQMLSEHNTEALVLQDILYVTAPRSLTREEHEAMYGDIPGMEFNES